MQSKCNVGSGFSRTLLIVAVIILPAGLAFPQQLIDRVVARVDGYAITQTDVQAAVGLGLIDAPPSGGASAAAVQQMIDRQLMLGEVQRFSPPEPDAAAVDAELAALKKRAAARLEALTRATGLDDGRIREFARETLRIRAYINQRFGTSTQVSEEEVMEYYRTHPQEFTRAGGVVPFAEAETVARERAAAERRRVTIAQWMSDLRMRADVQEPVPQ